MLKCVIIDDEPLAREGIANYVAQVSFLELVGQGSNPLELNNIMSEQNIDLIFLDIQMPVINGIDFLRINNNLPMVILTTAYPSYALEGYDLDVMDYLLKPITMDRFLKAVNKANEFFQLKNAPVGSRTRNGEKDYFFVKCDSKYEKIYFDEILYIQALQNYVTIHTFDKKYTSLLTLKNVEQNLKGNHFIKVHKSYIVSIAKIDHMESHEVTMGSHRIPISRNYRKEVKEKILGNKLWKNESKK